MKACSCPPDMKMRLNVGMSQRLRSVAYSTLFCVGEFPANMPVVK